MKRIYSVILLMSFLVGTLQPILPMIEYQLHEGDILELLGHLKDDGGTINTPVSISSNDRTSTHSTDQEHSLLNDNFYPVGITTATMLRMIVFPLANKWYLPVAKNVNSPAFLPNPPPPRLS